MSEFQRYVDCWEKSENEILTAKMGLKMNFRMITKNHGADSKIGSPEKSILEPAGLTTRQPGS